MKETFAVVGYGSIGRRHAGNLRTLRPEAGLVVVDPLVGGSAMGSHVGLPQQDAGRVMEGGHVGPTQQVGRYARVEEMLLEHQYLSGALVCAPHEAHVEALEKLTAAGVPVYLEKPVCSVRQYRYYRVRQGLEVIGQRTARVGMGFQYRYHAAAGQLCQMRDEVKSLSFVARDDLATRYGPTVLETMASHSIDLALWLLGPAYAVRLVSTGLRVSGNILHETGRGSNFDIDMEHGPRYSTIRALRTNNTVQVMTIDADPWMYQQCLGDWLSWAIGGEKAERMALLRDGLAVQDVMAKVRGKAEGGRMKGRQEEGRMG